MKLLFDEKTQLKYVPDTKKYLADIQNTTSADVVSSTDLIGPDELHLELTPEGLALVRAGLRMSGDFTDMLPRLKPIKLENELLVKAATPKNRPLTPTALDATAGMGEDSLLLAAAGFKVTLYERDEIIAALLLDTVLRASKTPGLESIVRRMEVIAGDSIAAMNTAETHFDAVFLDPMFPEREKTGLIKKKFQLLQQLESPCSDENDLLAAALRANPSRIVIKRPLKAPPLAAKKPSYSILGKTIRYDVIANIP